jgi:hypothetical protein
MATINHLFKQTDYQIPAFIKKLVPAKNSNSSSWLFEVKSSIHFSELILQSVISKKVKEHLPNYNVIYYNKTIISQLDSTQKNKPDFLLWKNDYSEWFVIEVELVNHSVSHIEGQISTFYNGDYSDFRAISKYVSEKFRQLDVLRFENMIKSKRPKLMLISDHINCDWNDCLDKFGCISSSIQIYADENENFSYRFNGEWPQEYSKFSFCILDKSLSALNISSPRFLQDLNIVSGEKIKLFYQGISENWELVIDEDKEILIYDGDYMSIDYTNNRWKIIYNNNNQFHLLKF